MNAPHIFRYVYRWCALVVALICTTVALAQPCVCVDCPQPIPTVTDFQVCYDVAGLANPTLGANGQAVCGVNLEFTHDYIENLSLTLIAPDAQQVQLLGPGVTGLSNIATAGARWNVNLLPCGAAVFPFPGTGPTFSGSNATWQIFGNYSGSYHPFAGCLQDFNGGPANGQWCLRVESNAIITAGDRLVNFSVEFCDDSGEACCYAEPPVATTPTIDTVLCQGDTALAGVISFDPQLVSGYLTRFYVSRDDTLHAYLTDTFDLQREAPGDYEICGFSYWSGDANQLPAVGTPLGVLQTAISTGLVCAEQAAVCSRIRILPAVNIAVIDTTICEGEALFVGGISYTTSDSLQLNLPSSAGCDSLIDLRLRVLPVDSIALIDSFCQGDTFVIAGVQLTSPGDYVFPFTNQFGCDSIVELELIELPVFEASRDTAFCSGGGVVIGGAVVSSSGPFRENLQTVNGCDSIINWNLVELASSAEIRVSDTVLSCARLSIALVGVAPSIPSGATLTTLWRGPNATSASSPNWSATRSGWYYLEETLSYGGTSCTATDSIFIAQDTAIAGVSLPDTLRLTCTVDTLLLTPQTTGSVSYQFFWSSPNGPSTDSFQRATVPGTYQVIAQRTDNICRDTASVVVIEDRQVPGLQFLTPDTLTCVVDSVALDASGSVAPNVSIQWSTTAAVPLPSAGGIAYTSTPGAYLLMVVDTLNGCFDSTSVLVQNDTSSLRLRLAFSDTLSCSSSTVSLSASPTEPLSSLLWLSPTGDTIGQTNPIGVGEPGTFRGIGISSVSGCRVESLIEVPADTVRPVARISQPDTLKCFPPLVVLDASSSSGEHPISFLWEYTSTAVIAGSATAFLSTAGGGAYQVIVTDNVNGCADTTSVTLIEETTPPPANAGLDGRITCSASTVSLGDPTAATTGLNFRWSGVTGGLVGFSDGVVATASLEGTYVLTVTDAITGCLARDTVEVTRDQDVPIVQIPDTTLLGCNQQFTILSGLGSSTGTVYRYAWTSADGAFSGPRDELDVRVSSSGTYRLTITDTTTNCVGFAEAIVIDDCPAFVVVFTPDTINCYTGPQITLTVQGNTGPGTSVSWSARTGQVVSGANTYSPLVEGGGWYVVEVGQQYTGTTAIDSIFVVVDTIAPVARIVSGLTLTCGDISTCAELDASPSTGLADMTLTWTSLGGRFCGDTIGEIVRVNAAGIYEVLALNPRTGCIDQASVLVDVEPGVPVPDAGPDRVLACEQDSLILQANLPAQTQNRKWWWVDESGRIQGDTGMTQLVIDSAARFAFVVFDSTSGCSAADTVLVIQQACAPNARPVASGAITCVQDTITLSSPPQESMRFTWTGVDVVFGPVNGDAVRVWEAGEYRLIIQDSLFGLVDTAFVIVDQDTVRPLAAVAFPQNLTCVRDSVDLDGRLSMGSQNELLTYSWTSSNATPLSSVALLSVGDPGRYFLEVTSSRNGCTDTLSTQVQLDTVPPIVSISADGLFNCVTTSVVLDGSSSVGQGAITYDWLGLDGQVMVVTNQSSVTVTAPGAYQLVLVDQQNGCTAADTIEVNLVDETVVDAGINQVIDCRTNNAMLSGQVSQPGINVQWSGSSPACILSPNSLVTEITCSGEYYLSWTDSQSICTYYDTVLVADPALDFQLEIQGDTAITCLRSVLEFQGVSADPLVMMRWEGVGVDLISGREVTSPGQLSLIGTDTAGCSDTIVQEITLDTLSPVLSVADPDTITCARPLVRLQATNTNGRNSMLYRWDSTVADTLFGSVVRVSDAGTYNVRVTDSLNGCFAESFAIVEVDSTAPMLTLSTPFGTQLDCDLASVRIEAAVDPPNADVRWNAPAGQRINPGALSQDAEVGGIYVVSASHPTTGCITSEVVIIQDNSAPVGPYELSLSEELGCRVDSVQLQVTLPQNVTATWTDALGEVLASTWVDSAGTYAVVLRDTLTGCRTVDSIVVGEYIAPFTLSLPEADTLDCETAFVTLSAELSGSPTSQIEYRWVSPQGDTVQRSSSSTYDVGAGGLWTVVSFDQDSGCEQVAQRIVAVSGDAIQEVVLETTDASCPGDRDGLIDVLAVVGGQGPFSFQLDGGEPQSIGQFGLLEGGRYVLQVSDANGCTSTSEVIINQSSPKEILLPSRIEAFLGEELCLVYDIVGGGVPDSIRWSPSELLSCDTCDSPCLVALSGVDISVQMWFGRCLLEESTRIEVIDGADAVWPSAFSPNGDGSNDEWWVLPKGGKLSYCRVYDRWGSIVFESKSSGENLSRLWDGTQNGKELRPGVFVVEVGGTNALGQSYVVYGDVHLIK